MLLAPNFDDSEFDVNEVVPVNLRGNLPALASLLQQFRDLTNGSVQGGSRIQITSCYRDPQRNSTVPFAVSDSQHLTAQAADVEFLDVDEQTIARLLLGAEAAGNGPSYSQAIFYVNDHHVHIGLPFTDGRANGQKLVHYGDGHYEILDPNGNLGDLPSTPPNPLSRRTTPAPH